jgi:RHS repeat-associated protein
MEFANAPNVTTIGYPLYDGHGNMRATLYKSGTSYGTQDWRTYDVSGGVRSGSATGAPNQRYCANLGPVQDDETGLIYMRARYYEPGTGRFVSEDPAMDGGNWFVYCANNPVSYVDDTGQALSEEFIHWLVDKVRLFSAQLAVSGLVLMGVGVFGFASDPKDALMLQLVGGIVFFAGVLTYAYAEKITGMMLGLVEAGVQYLVGGFLLLGTLGLALIGLVLGTGEDDPDASIFFDR